MKYHVLFFSIFGMAKIMAKKLPFLPSIFSPFSPYWQKWQTFPPIIAIMVKMANISSPFLSFFSILAMDFYRHFRQYGERRPEKIIAIFRHSYYSFTKIDDKMAIIPPQIWEELPTVQTSDLTM